MTAIVLIAGFLSAGAALAGTSDSTAPALPNYLQGVGIDQKLNAQVPLDAQFADDSGRTVTLRSYLGKRPVVLALVYYTCPALCNQILQGLVRGLRPLSLEPGRDFDIIAISINPSEGPSDAAEKRDGYVRLYSKRASPDGWHFLTGTGQSIGAVANAVGFHYRYDPQSKMFFHGAGIMVLTPEGRVARYLYGVDYEPKDLKLGLVEASHNRVGSAVDRILLFCYHYDPSTGRYTATVINLLHAAAALFILLLLGLLILLWRYDVLFQRRASDEVFRP